MASLYVIFLASLYFICILPKTLTSATPNRHFLIQKKPVERETRSARTRTLDGLGKKKVIIDTDAGVDDAQAILLILSNPKIEVIAITCTVGNTAESYVERNVLQILKIANRLDIPVYRGAQAHLINADNSTYDPVPYYGIDGFGDVNQSQMPSVNLTLINKRPASLAIIDLAVRFHGKVTILALAPLTNIATAIKVFPDLTKCLKEIIVLGGNNEGIGNETPAAEFNFHRDPEAAGIVLAQTGCRITLLNGETCLQTAAIPQSFKCAFFNHSSTQGRFIAKINKLKNDRAYAEAAASGLPPVFLFGDEIAASLLVNDAVCKKASFWPTEVELEGRWTRGQCVVDKRGYLPDRKNLRNCHVIDTGIIQSLLDRMINYKF